MKNIQSTAGNSIGSFVATIGEMKGLLARKEPAAEPANGSQ
jgi:hypothetical protein